PRRRAEARPRRDRARHRPRRPHRPGAGAARRSADGAPHARRGSRRRMSTFVLLTITGFGLGAMYFLIASGLSLIYGLMGVLNFAHGAFLTVGAYGMWFTEDHLGGVAVLPRFLIGVLAGLAVGALFAGLVEFVLIRPLYRRHIDQVLVTVGLALATVALVTAVWGNDARLVAAPGWLGETTGVLGAHI